MPTKDEMLELITFCELEKDVMLNGKHGLKVIGPNGNSIFLPHNSVAFEKMFLKKRYCNYWTSSAMALSVVPTSRAFGYGVRAVRS